MHETGMTEDDARADYRWLKLADRVSLTVCRNDRTQGLELEPGRTGFWDGTTLRLRPFPLAGTTTFRVAARWIDDRRYESADELITELATRRWGSFSVQVAGFDVHTS